MNRLTVCLCARNEEGNLDRFFHSLWQPTDTKIVVVDHGSADRTPILLQRWSARRGSDLNVVRFTGKGIAAARNFAVRHCDSEWIAFVDADCEFARDWLPTALAQIDSVDQTVAGIGGGGLIPNGPLKIYRGYSLSLRSFVGGHRSLLNRRPSQIQETSHLPTFNALFRKSALEAVGGFDESFERGAEDLDLGFRLRGAGFRLVGCPDLWVTHYLTRSWLQWIGKMFQYGKLRCDFTLRRRQFFTLPFLAPAFFLPLMIAPWFWGNEAGGIATLAYAGAVLVGLTKEVHRQKATFGEGWAGWTVTVITHVAFSAGVWSEALGRMVPRIRKEKYPPIEDSPEAAASPGSAQ